MGKTAYKDAPPTEDTGYGNRALTVSEVAEMIGEPQVIITRFMDQGVIPHHMVGNDRKILLRDALAFKKQRERGRKALDRMIARDQEMGLYPKP